MKIRIIKIHGKYWNFIQKCVNILNLFFSFDLLDVSLMFEAMIFFSILAFKQLVKKHDFKVFGTFSVITSRYMYPCYTKNLLFHVKSRKYFQNNFWVQLNNRLTTFCRFSFSYIKTFLKSYSTRYKKQNSENN